jgi:excisionase family DNA binding protein
LKRSTGGRGPGRIALSRRSSNGEALMRIDTDAASQMCSRKETARRLNIGLSTVDSLCRKKVLRSLKCGSRTLIDIASIDAYAGRRKPAAPIEAGCEIPSADGKIILQLRYAPRFTKEEAVQLALALVSFLIGGPEPAATDDQRSGRRRLR